MSERERGSRGLLTLAEIKELDLIGYLSELGFEPVKVQITGICPHCGMNGLHHLKSTGDLIVGMITESVLEGI